MDTIYSSHRGVLPGPPGLFQRVSRGPAAALSSVTTTAALQFATGLPPPPGRTPPSAAGQARMKGPKPELLGQAAGPPRLVTEGRPIFFIIIVKLWESRQDIVILLCPMV